MPIRDGADAHGDLERELEEEERRATVEDGRGRRGTGPVSSNVPIEMSLRQSGILGRADRKTNPLSLWLRLSPLPVSLISGSPSITPLSQVYTYCRPSLLARSRHSGFFHGLPPTEKTAGDPYFIFLLISDVLFSPPKSIGITPLRTPRDGLEAT